MNSLQSFAQSLPGFAAVLGAIAALVTALGSVRAGRAKDEQLKAKDEQLKTKDVQIAQLEQLTPERLGEQMGGYKAYYHALLDQRKDELDRAELALGALRESKSVTEVQFEELRQEREELQGTVNALRSRLRSFEQASQALMAFDNPEAPLAGSRARESQADTLARQRVLEAELERLIAMAFQKQGLKTSRPPRLGDQQVDLLVEGDGITTVVEVRGPQGRADGSTVRRLIDARRQLGADRAILIAYGRVTAEARLLAEQQSVRILNRDELETLLDHITEPATSNTTGLTHGGGGYFRAPGEDRPTTKPAASDAPDSP